MPPAKTTTKTIRALVNLLWLANQLFSEEFPSDLLLASFCDGFGFGTTRFGKGMERVASTVGAGGSLPNGLNGGMPTFVTGAWATFFRAEAG